MEIYNRIYQYPSKYLRYVKALSDVDFLSQLNVISFPYLLHTVLQTLLKTVRTNKRTTSTTHSFQKNAKDTNVLGLTFEYLTK